MPGPAEARSAIVKMKRMTIQGELQKNPELKEDDINAMREWIESQPHFPSITDMTIVLFLHCSHYDMNVAKTTLQNFYTFQYNNPHICINRDPTNEEIKQIAKAVGIVILNGKDKNGNTVVFQRLLNTDPSLYNMDVTLKLSHMLSTVWQLENGTGKGTVLIYDQRGFGFGHMAQCSISSLRNTVQYVQDCAPLNVVGIHVIYTNAIIDAILALFKPFMRTSLFRLITTYREENLKDLYEIVPQEILPKEYGGNESSLEQLSEESFKKLIQYREYFLEEDKNIQDAAAKAKSSKPPGILGRVGAWVGYSS